MKESHMNKHTFVVNASTIITDLHGNVLIAKRSLTEDKNPGKWGIPGGKMDAKDESIEAGLVREVREELGIHITLLKFYESHTTIDDKNKLYIVFTSWVDPTLEVKLSNEVASVKWINSLKEFKETDFTPNTFNLLREYLING